MRRVSILLSGALLAGMLSGCSGQTAYDDGMALVAEGRVEEGMSKFQEALQQNPRDVEYRTAFLQARERILTQTVERADRTSDKGAFAEARSLYQHALSVDPNYERARDGLLALEAKIRQKDLLDEADGFVAKNQFDSAGQRIARVFAESPNNQRALALKRTIEAKTAAAGPEARLAQTYRKPITIEFKDVTLKQLFEVISHTSGLNFLFDKDVKTDQRASIFLRNSTIEGAVRFICLTNQLDQQVLDGNTVLIYPNTPPKQKDYQELAIRTFYLANAEAKTVANTLKTIIKSRDIAVDEKLNMVVVRDTPEAVRMAERLVAVEDVAEPEVMLDVEVLEIQRNSLQDLGLQWPASISVQPGPLSGGSPVSGTSPSSTTGTSSSNASSLSLRDLTHQTLRSMTATVPSGTLNANLQDSHAKLLTNPRIRVRNHEKAKILIGQRVPNITSTATSTGFLSQSVNYIDVGLTLNVEPTIYLDDNVGIKMSLEVSSIISQITTQTGTSAYEIGTRTASTTLRLKNGETDILAGLIDSQERTSGNKVPGLGDAPIMGRLFGATTDDNEKTEIVLSITPHLVRNIQRPDAVDALFKSGTETSLRGDGGYGAAGSAAVSPVPSAAPAPASRSPASPDPVAAGAGAAAAGTAGASSVQAGSGIATDASALASSVDGTAGAVPGTGVAQLQWQGTSQVAVGGTLSLNLVMQSSQPITSLPMTLSFDTSKLQVTNITEGPFMRSSGAATTFSSRLSGSGQLTLSDVVSSGTGAQAQGVFATVNFRALAAAPTTTVQLVSASPVGVDGMPVTLMPPSPFTVQIAAP